MSEMLWSIKDIEADRARRLFGCGFDCFKSGGNPEQAELRYAGCEVQSHSMHAKRRAHKGDAVQPWRGSALLPDFPGKHAEHIRCLARASKSRCLPTGQDKAVPALPPFP